MNHLSSPATRLATAALAAALLCALMRPAHPALAQSATTPAAPALPAATPAPAQIPIVVGILDTQALIFDSTAGKGVTAQANAILKGYEDDFQKKEDALRAQAVAVEAQRSANPPISQADLEAKRKTLALQDDQLRQAMDKNKQALDDRVSRARQAIVTVAAKIVQEIAKVRGFTLVLNYSAVNLSPPAWNITNDAMQRLNKTLPAVKL